MNTTLNVWNEKELQELLTLTQLSPGSLRSRYNDANLNGRCYGGQLLGQTISAAASIVEPGRLATAAQYMFLSGALPDLPVNYDITVLQNGKRFTSVSVMASQPGRGTVLQATVSFARPAAAPEHARSFTEHKQGSSPENLPGLDDLPPQTDQAVRRMQGFSLLGKGCLDFRFADPRHLVNPGAGLAPFCYWLRARNLTATEPNVHAAAFAFMSDWWLCFGSLAPHLWSLSESQKLYIATLNHTIWFHREIRADEWLYIECSSPCAAAGRGLSIATAYDKFGTPVATATQECLMAYS